MYKTFLFSLVLIGCEAGLEPLQERETLCTSDSTVCWSQPIGDPRNTIFNDPRCNTVKTDSLWQTTCEFGDTTEVSIAYSQYYKDIRPDFPHNGGGIVYTIVNGDTLSGKEW